MKVRLLSLFLLTASVSHSASISFSIINDTAVATASDVALDATFIAYIGTYTGGALNASTASFSLINADFSILYSANFSTGAALGADGYLDAASFAFTDSDGFANVPLFVWFTDGNLQNAIVTGFGNIPADASIPNSVDFFIDSSNAATLTYVLGSYDPFGTNLAGSGGNVV